ncbi:M20/M25/M40 family metallo-hydrolase [Marinirhabdus gelatinilytica]|uniref:Vacuolar membrane protease n=1 Tax=Marinirhabdus gelatinilytica TaxID=1703343 RepID=A0A370QJY5_9FLAO|nr:M20/M25/M40 family metallo-hydrolase [Marinirhabdus gelatinilytica]RDK88677.1 peptidase M28-like protein [Marinirhabdus gelatinilytica]
MKFLSGILSFLLVLFFIWYSFFSLMPNEGVDASAPPTEFSTQRALTPLKEISKAPHYHGSEEHTRVRAFLLKELQALGLETEVQEGFVLNKGWRGLDRPKNIIGVWKGTGNGKSLVLLSHYDSAKVPSFGASDAGSGIVTILESLRAYKAAGKQPKNDIVVLFTDAEEIGLDGAQLFVNEHPLAKNAGLVLNFEARGSGGPSNMILETNGGNANLIKAFVAANPEYPVASSLMYSIYKMLPNDTDSTIFRKDGDIDSFFFAFIDDHYDYHTANDTYERLDRETLQHQGSYLLPLLHYFAEADLSTLKAEQDHVYVNAPFVKMVTYSFSWVIPMLVVAVALFLVLLFYGFSKRRLQGKAVGRGFGALLLSLVICGALGYLGWMLLKAIYPQYTEIQHGFTYNGHWYIAFFVLLSTAITFKIYRKFNSKKAVASFYVAPLTLWLIVNAAVAIFLKGAAYWIIPIFFGLLSLFVLLKQEKPSLIFLTLLAVPALSFFAPLIQFFPVGLGLKMLVISCVFVVLLFGLLVPVFGFYRWKNMIALGSFLFTVVLFFVAHAKSDFTETRQKPNSLVYYQNTDTNESFWLTYDKVLDPWTQGYLGENPEKASKYVTSAAGSKYNTGYSFAAKAPSKNIAPLELRLEQDTTLQNTRKVTFTIIPKRDVHEIGLYTNAETQFETLSFNGKIVPKDTTDNAFHNRKSNMLLRYFVADEDSLEVSFSVQKDIPLNFQVLEYSYDLLAHPQFSINKRPKHTMPKPFVNTDAVVIHRSFVVDDLMLEVEKATDSSMVSPISVE